MVVHHYPVLSPKCVRSSVSLNCVSSPMYSTPRMSVIAVPSLPPRLRLQQRNKEKEKTQMKHHVESVTHLIAAAVSTREQLEAARN